MMGDPISVVALDQLVHGLAGQQAMPDDSWQLAYRLLRERLVLLETERQEYQWAVSEREGLRKALHEAEALAERIVSVCSGATE